jgi:hypothetical protein
MLGDWDAAERELTQTADSDELRDYPLLTCYRGLLAALRGDVATAQTMLAGLGDLRASEDPQMKGFIALVEASTAAALRQHQDALRHARGTLAHVGVVGISAEDQRWAWALAARAAHELRDGTATSELLALLDSYQPGEIAPMLRAERDLALARLTAADGDQAVAVSFVAAMASLRERGTPYHLAHGLLDYAEYLARDGDADAAAQAITEARDVARHLRCPPLLDRADAVEAAPSQIQT